VPGLDDYGALLRSGQAAVPDYAADEARKQLLALHRAQEQRLTAQAQREAADELGFQNDLTTVLAHPSAQGYSALALKHPKFAQQIKSSFEMQDKAKQDSDLQAMSEVYSAAANGKHDLAAALMKRRIDADKQAGQDTTHDQAIMDALDSGDPVQQKGALGMIGVTLSAITGADKFEQTLGALTKGNEGFTLSQGQKRFDSSGHVIASVAPEQDYLVIPEGGKAIPKPGGGDPASIAAGAPTDVSPAAASVASTLASSGLPAPVVAGFMGNFHAEGGYDGAQGDGGSASGIGQWRGERAANFERVIGKPATEASHEEQAKFVTWEMQNPEAAGMTVKQRDAILAAKTPAQAAALIDQFYERSSGRDRNIRMAAANAFAGGASGDPSGTLYGAPKAKPTRMTPQEVAAEGLDPKVVYYRDANGVPQAVSGQSTRDNPLKPWPGQALTARSENQAAVTNIDNALKLLDPKNNSKEAQNARNAIGIGTGMLGDQFTQYNDPQGADFRALLGQIGGVVIKDISGAAVTAAEDERLKKWVPRVTDRPEIAAAKLRNMRREIQQRNYAFDTTYSPDQGYRAFQSGDGSKPTKVRSIQEARKLPSGTLFTTPDGRTLRKK
jgi:hypothetical protein